MAAENAESYGGSRWDKVPVRSFFVFWFQTDRTRGRQLRGVMPYRDIHLLLHDCAPLGHSAGGCIIDLETHRVLGVHVSRRYLETGTAVPLWMLHDDPLLKRCQVTYAAADAQELTAVTSQIERLARSRLWADTRTAITGLYQRAFGSNSKT
jgi:hypothetical protein